MQPIIYVGPGEVSGEAFQRLIDRAYREGATIHILSHTTIRGAHYGPIVTLEGGISFCRRSRKMESRKSQPFWTKDWRARK